MKQAKILAFLALSIGGLAIILCAPFLFKSSPPPAKATDAGEVVAAAGFGDLNNLVMEFRSAIDKGRIHHEDFYKLDFSLPEDNGFGDNVEYEVFNPKSPRALFPKSSKPYSSELIQALTGGKSSKMLFNLRRHIEQGVTRERLYAIIPDLTADACQEVNEHKQVQAFEKLEIPDSTTQIVEDTSRLAGCIKAQDRLFWFIGLGYRTI